MKGSVGGMGLFGVDRRSATHPVNGSTRTVGTRRSERLYKRFALGPRSARLLVRVRWHHWRRRGGIAGAIRPGGRSRVGRRGGSGIVCWCGCRVIRRGGCRVGARSGGRSETKDRGEGNELHKLLRRLRGLKPCTQLTWKSTFFCWFCG